MEDRCVCCGAVIPEGRQVCPDCGAEALVLTRGENGMFRKRKEPSKRALEEKERNKWIPVENKVPNNNRYVLVSFVNYPVVSIARYEEDDDGGGSFYPDDDDKSFLSFGIIVDAWQELPKNYSESETDEKVTNGDRIRSMTDEELAFVLMCPYENLSGECFLECEDSKNGCMKCTLEWLRKEVEG